MLMNSGKDSLLENKRQFIKAWKCRDGQGRHGLWARGLIDDKSCPCEGEGSMAMFTSHHDVEQDDNSKDQVNKDQGEP